MARLNLSGVGNSRITEMIGPIKMIGIGCGHVSLIIPRTQFFYCHKSHGGTERNKGFWHLAIKPFLRGKMQPLRGVAVNLGRPDERMTRKDKWMITNNYALYAIEKVARARIAEMEFNEVEEAFIWADWPDMNEHIDWLLTASRAEIKAWIDANY